MPKIDVEKTIYFVRHGESEDNTRPVFQSIESPLSERGREQVLKVAERATKLDFEALVSSGYTRAKETAEAIAEATNKLPEYSDLFTERVKPSFINGKPHEDVEAVKVGKEWKKSLFQKGLKVQDGENYEEIVERADKALDFLKNHKAKNILVVTHGFFLRVIMARVMLGNSMTEENLKHFQSVASMKNTGLSVLQYARWSDEVEPKWRFWIYNDHNHLG
ncbi:MAG: histidine phosphatase family protein [Patescibacteria group bacterium]